MTNQEAKEILARYRVNTAEDADPEFAEALKMANEDGELGDWLREQQQFHQTTRAQFAAIDVPAGLKARLLAEIPREKISRSFWGKYEIAALAAGLAILIGGVVYVKTMPPNELRFGKFRARMVTFALRTYQMDILTDDAAAVRQYIASRGGVADFEVTPALTKLPVQGGGRLTWQNRPVSMMCFKLPDNETLYMFVIDQQQVKGALPPTAPVVGKEKTLATVEWTANGKAYLLAAATDPKTLAALAPAAN